MNNYFKDRYCITNLQKYPIVKTVGKNGPVFPLEMVSLQEKQFLADEVAGSGRSGLAAHKDIKNELLSVSCRTPDVLFTQTVGAMKALVATCTSNSSSLAHHFCLHLEAAATPMCVPAQTLHQPDYKKGEPFSPSHQKVALSLRS